MAKVLIVEDDPDTTSLLAALLKGDGHQVVHAANGEDSLRLLRREEPDMVILDLVLPGLDGVEVCRRARQFTYIPILMLTGRGAEIDKIIGLEAGADDYLAKPFKPGEFRARVRAQLRRSLQWGSEGTPGRPRLERGPLLLDPERFEAALRGRPLQLTRLEFDLLYLLAERPGIVHSRDRLLETLWGDDGFIVTRGIDVHISRLRKKIEEDPSNPALLLTVRGVGYKFAFAS